MGNISFLPGGKNASQTPVDASGFDNFLSPSEDTVQKALAILNAFAPTKITVVRVASIPALVANAHVLVARDSLQADAYTEFLSNFEDYDGAVRAVDESKNNYPITFAGSAQIDTAQYCIGSSSLYLPAGANYIYTIPAAGQNLSADFTLSLNFRMAAKPATTTWWYLMSHRTDANNRLVFIFDNRTTQSRPGIRFDFAVASTWYILKEPNFSADHADYTAGNWNNIEICRNGNNWYIRRNGVETATVVNAVGVGNYTGNLFIGGDTVDAVYCNGWIDNLKIDKGICRNTVDFTPLTEFFKFERFYYIDDAGQKWEITPRKTY